MPCFVTINLRVLITTLTCLSPPPPRLLCWHILPILYSFVISHLKSGLFCVTFGRLISLPLTVQDFWNRRFLNRITRFFLMVHAIISKCRCTESTVGPYLFVCIFRRGLVHRRRRSLRFGHRGDLSSTRRERPGASNRRPRRADRRRSRVT